MRRWLVLGAACAVVLSGASVAWACVPTGGKQTSPTTTAVPSGDAARIAQRSGSAGDLTTLTAPLVRGVATALVDRVVHLLVFPHLPLNSVATRKGRREMRHRLLGALVLRGRSQHLGDGLGPRAG